MNITPEMKVEDEKRWYARDVITELSYCGNYMRDRKDMTNLDIRFYAYLMRKAHDMLKDQEPRVMTLDQIIETGGEEPIYLETPYTDRVVPAVLQPDDFEDGYLCFGGEWHNCGYYHGMYYGKTWRCWTSRPTPKQMRDTPWEG